MNEKNEDREHPALTEEELADLSAGATAPVTDPKDRSPETAGLLNPRGRLTQLNTNQAG
jgi:hypothetical protein